MYGLLSYSNEGHQGIESRGNLEVIRRKDAVYVAGYHIFLLGLPQALPSFPYLQD